MLRWSILAFITIIILIIRTYNYGLFQGKDWFLYLILMISVGFVVYHKNNLNKRSGK
jgi:hypothetical protein